MEKKFYAISTTTDYKSVKNIYPQATLIASDSQKHQWINTDDKGYEEDITFQFKVNAKTVLTDFLSQSNLPFRGLLISDRVNTILSEYNFGGKQIVNVNAEYKKSVYNYHWFYLLQDCFNEIDFKKTSFYLSERMIFKRILSYKKMSRQEYLSKSMKLDLDRELWPEESTVYVKDSRIPEYDLLFLFVSGFRVVVSERLKARLLAEKLTGVEFSEQAFLIVKPAN